MRIFRNRFANPTRILDKGRLILQNEALIHANAAGSRQAGVSGGAFGGAGGGKAETNTGLAGFDLTSDEYRSRYPPRDPGR